MEPDRIAELLGPFLTNAKTGLTPDDFSSISTYINVMSKWNRRINLTAVRSEEEIVTRHFGESLFAAVHLFPNARPVASTNPLDSMLPSVADLGSGAGFPGIPIKIWNQHIELTLIEANQKKAVFLNEIVRKLQLSNVNVKSVRAETVSNRFDIVTIRAVECFQEILPIAYSLLAENGKLALLISEAQLSQARSILPQLDWQQPISMPKSDSRVFTTGNKKS